jgi:hypothetical protein
MVRTVYKLDGRIRKQPARLGILGPILDSILRFVNGTSVCHSSSTRWYDDKAQTPNLRHSRLDLESSPTNRTLNPIGSSPNQPLKTFLFARLLTATHHIKIHPAERIETYNAENQARH